MRLLSAASRMAASAAGIAAAAWVAGPARPDCRPPFVRGDANDDMRIDMSDAVAVLGHLFRGGPAPPCASAADTNDDGQINLTDGVFLLSALFAGRSIPPPHPECGPDPTADGLECAAFASCPPPGTEEVCDGADNDCDGLADEDFDLASDPEHCGECERRCGDLEWDNVAAYACVSGQCRIASCAEGFHDRDGVAKNGCESLIPRNGTPCDDGNPCTENDMYLSGLCGGTPRNCSALADPCNRGVCDPATGDCVPRPVSKGRPCDDGDPDTARDQCDGEGNCVGTPF